MKVYYCDCCGEEICKHLLPSFNKMIWHYCTSYLVDGYHNTTIELHLHSECMKEIKVGRKEPKPLNEVVPISFAGRSDEYERED